MKTCNLGFSFLTIFLCIFSFPMISLAQLQNAHLSGSLSDPSGASLAAVQVTAHREGNAASDLVITASSFDGSYALSLAPGRYHITVTKDPFLAKESDVTLQPGETLTLNFRLELAPMAATVLVTGEVSPIAEDQSPAPSSILTSEQIEQRQAVTLPDLLNTQAGFAVARTGAIGGLTTMFLDGGNSNYTKLFIDGTPANEPGGIFNFSSLSLDNVDKVEVVHGAESALYGSDAMSGVIQLFSHQGSTHVPAFELYSDGGDLQSARGGAQISGLLGHFDYSGAASYLTTDGQGPNDAFINRTAAGNFGYSFSDTNQLRLTVRSNSSWAAIPSAVVPGQPPTLGQYDKLKDLTSGLSWLFNPSARWQNRLSGWESRILDANFIPGFGPPFVDQYNRAGFSDQSNYSFTKGLLALGYQYEVENAYPSGIVGGTHARRNNQAGFADGRWFPIPRVTLSAGFRVEANTTFGVRTAPRAGVVYAVRNSKDFWGDTRLRFGYGEGIKEPALEQSFGSDPCYPGNPNLKPEESQTINATLDQYLASDRVRVSITFFANRYTDIISFAYNPPPNPNFCGTYFNTDLAHARGVNLSTQWRLKKWLTVDGYYTHDATKVVTTDNPPSDPDYTPGLPLLRRPQDSGSIILNVYYAKVNWNFIGYFSGPRLDISPVTFGPANNGGYARFDMAASYNLTRGLAFTARVINLFDKQYQDALGYPALGQTYYLGMRYKFSGRN